MIILTIEEYYPNNEQTIRQP